MQSEVRSPVTGKVIEILVATGDRIAVDAELLVLESMKMEIPVAAEADGVVRGVHVSVEDTVKESDLLITLDVE